MINMVVFELANESRVEIAIKDPTTLSRPADIMQKNGISISDCKQIISNVYSASVCDSCVGPVAEIKPDAGFSGETPFLFKRLNEVLLIKIDRRGKNEENNIYYLDVYNGINCFEWLFKTTL